MALLTTPAIVLHTFPYGETSKIARLLTPGHGVQSAIAKGALRPKSRFGARLQVLSEGVAQLYMKSGRELHTLAEFDTTGQRPSLAGDVARYAAAMALAELLVRCCPAEPHPEIYDLAVAGLDRLETAAPDLVGATSLAVLWAAVVGLGFAPRMDACARDGRALPAGAAAFSVTDGGFLCAACARGEEHSVLQAEDRTALEQLIAGSGEEIGPLDGPHTVAHRRLLVRFVERHVAEGKDLKALGLWQELA